MPKIDYFFTHLSPYTYLAGDALENIAEKVRASIHYRPLDPRHEARQALHAPDCQFRQ